MRAFAFAVVLALFAPAAAQAEDRHLAVGGAHAAYAVGGALFDEAGVRQGLDLGIVGALTSGEHGSSSGLPGTEASLLFGASTLLGMGKYPSYVAGEIGGATDNAFTDTFAVVGPAARVDPKAGGGVALRVGGDVVLVQLALHAIAIVVPDRDVVLALTIGLGRN